MPNSLLRIVGVFTLAVCHLLGADPIFPPKNLNGVNGLNARQIFANPSMYDVQGYWAWLVVGSQGGSFFRSALTFTNGTADTSVSCGWVLYNQRGANGGDVQLLWQYDTVLNSSELMNSNMASYPVHPFSSRTIEFVAPYGGANEFKGYARIQCYSDHLETLSSGVSATGTVRHYSPEGDLMSEMFNRISFALPTNKWVIPLEEGKTEASTGSQTTRTSTSHLGVAVALVVGGSPPYTGCDYVPGPVKVRFTLMDQNGTKGPVWEGLWQNGLDYIHASGEVRGIVLSEIFGDKLFFVDKFGKSREKLYGALVVEALGQTVQGNPIEIYVVANKATVTLDNRWIWVSPPAIPVPINPVLSQKQLDEILKN